MLYNVSMVEVSVILPVYNRGHIVSRALKSLEMQSFKNFELIIVNDGSSDNTESVCNGFCVRDQNWNLFSIPHAGVSNARKFGIKKAQGKYISFIDSDDFVEPDFLKNLYENIQGVDISMCNYRVSYEGAFCTRNFLFHRPGRFERDKILGCLISDISVKAFLCNKMFKRELFDDIFVPEISCCEDKIICLQLVFNSQNICISNEILYHYAKNPNSITWKTNSKIMDGSIYASEFIRDFLCLKRVYGKFRINHLFFCFQIFFVILDVCFFECIVHKRSPKKFYNLFFDRFAKLLKSTKLSDKNNLNIEKNNG